MKLRFMGAAALTLALAGSALAADLPSRKAPPYMPPPPPPPLWTGFYVGLNAGGTWSESNSTTIATSSGSIFSPPLGATGVLHAQDFALASNAILGSGSNGGFIGGGQIGYNWQFANSFVAGIEADIQGVTASSSTSSAATLVRQAAEVPVGALLTASKKLDYLGTVRGRLGYLVTPTLLAYATGGLAYGGASANAAFVTSELRPPSPGNLGAVFSNGAFSDTRVGWTVGGGLEWMFLPNWSAKAEYLYYDLGNVTYALAPTVGVLNGGGGVGFVNISQATTRFNGHVVRAGVNYHFNFGAPAPVVAKY